MELHLPGYNFCGLNTRLAERLKRGDQPKNRVDAICLQHDLDYHSATTSVDYERADLRMLHSLDTLENLTCCERLGRWICSLSIRAKVWLRRVCCSVK